jgi:hypothetical protein
VLLHVALNHPDLSRLAGLEPTLAHLLERPDETSLAVLRRVVEAAAQRADAQGPGQMLERIFGLLRRLGRMHLLRRCGWLVPERIVESFPQDVGDWLQTLDLARGEDRAELLDVLRRVGPRRVLDAAATLARPEALGAPGLAARLLELPAPELAPLAKVLLERHAGETRVLVAAWLRSLQLPGPVAAALHVADESVPLPDGLLEILLAQLLGAPTPGDAGACVVPTLAQFVRASAGRADRRARRIQALRLLGDYDHPEAHEVLSRVAHGKRWLVVPIEDAVMRRAASEALARRGAA